MSRIATFVAAFGGFALSATAQLKVTSDFEGGSAQVLAIDQEAQAIRITPAGDPQRGWPNWWHLRVDGVDPSRPLELEVAAAEVMFSSFGDPPRVLGPGWTLPICASFSTDGTNWEQTSPGERPISGSNRSRVYRVRTETTTVWLAWGPPLTPEGVSSFIGYMARRYEFAEALTLAHSREGRPVMALRVRAGAKPAGERAGVCVIARQHAWECGGSWVGLGLAEWLAGDDELARWMRENAEVLFVPLMDVDNVATGNGGKGAQPHDHNEDWSAAPVYPEVAAVQKQITALAAEGRMAVFLDLHNPAAGNRVQTFYADGAPYVGDDALAAQNRFLDLARSAFGGIQVNNGNPSQPEHLPMWKRMAGPWAREHGNASTVSLTVETPWNTPQSTADGYREVGRKLGATVAKYLQADVE